MTKAGQKSSTILIVDPTDNASLRSNLSRNYGLTVSYSADGQQALAELLKGQPDFLVLNAELTTPSASTLLSDLAAQGITPAVVLIGANGKAQDHFDYSNIIGWINPPYTAAELASLIHSVVDGSLDSDWVLTKRSELAAANEQLVQRVQAFDTLSEIGKSVTSLLDLEAILYLVVEAAVTLTKAEESYLLLVDELSGDLYLRAEFHMAPDQVKDFWVKASDSISGQVVRTGQPIILSKNSNTLKLKTGLTVYSLINVPLRVGPEVIGVLGINNRHEKRAFSHHDQELLSVLAGWAAIAIQNAKLYETTKAHNRDLELINHISRLVSSTLDVEQIPRLLIQRATEIFEAECGSLALIDLERGAIVFQAAYDAHGNEIKHMKDFLMPLGQGIVGLVAESGRPYIANDVTRDPDWSPIVDRLTGFKTKKVMAIPLIAEGETFGVVELLNKKSDFNQDDVNLFALVASSTAIAIKNAQQYAALKTANQALQEAQTQKIASERWTVLGQAAGNLAHRINNSTALVPIAAQHLQELLQEVPMPQEVRQEVDDNLGRIRRNTLYTVELAMALLRRFRKIPTEAHDINALIQEAIELVELPQNIRVILHLDPDLPEINTSSLLIDVFVELIVNAKKAIGDNTGLLRIASLSLGHQVLVQITDNGPGIPPEHRSRIFEMFYTDNPKGLGFGLWWAKTFLEQQRGQITVESHPDEGSTFTITLPS